MLFHLAQVNVGRARASLDDPIMAGFVAQLEAVNALAEASPGFVWRLKGEGSDEAVRAVYPDPLLLVNLSLWRDVDALKAYVYRGQHGAAFRDRKAWFDEPEGPAFALWWIPAGTLPTVEAAKARLTHLAVHGPTVQAFTFREMFAAP